jgi:hypothetical protein
MHAGEPLIVSGLINPSLRSRLKIMVARARLAARLAVFLDMPRIGILLNPSGKVDEN